MISPSALLKVVAALGPVMGNAEIGEAMRREISAMFDAINKSAQMAQGIAAALRDIDRRLERIEKATAGEYREPLPIIQPGNSHDAPAL